MQSHDLGNQTNTMFPSDEDLLIDEEVKKIQTDLNMYCCDCLAQPADWVSVNNAIFLCIECAGVHRGLGVQVSFVRSLKLDLLDHDQIAILKKGGNRKFLEFCDLYKLDKDAKMKQIKYITKAAYQYRSLL